MKVEVDTSAISIIHVCVLLHTDTIIIPMIWYDIRWEVRWGELCLFLWRWVFGCFSQNLMVCMFPTTSGCQMVWWLFLKQNESFLFSFKAFRTTERPKLFPNMVFSQGRVAYLQTHYPPPPTSTVLASLDIKFTTVTLPQLF